ncbi:MAG: DUF2461 domain-containing protein [Clostridia bacterium]|nr:DUF2461 domain-containing protein [Clostridia bacterium]
MEHFRGFDRDTFLMLAENKFNDSRPYYESVKETLKQKVTLPMRGLCSRMANELFEIDPLMNLVPGKMVSRIRRDTRRAKEKNMYRDNIWAMFMRPKQEWRRQPCMWFEVFPGGFTIGVGVYDVDPLFMAAFRESLLADPEGFRAALQSVSRVGAVADLERYAKDKPGSGTVGDDLKLYYNAKSLYFIRYDSDMEPLFDGRIEDLLRESIRAYAPMYRFFLRVMEKTIEEKGKQHE